jgi:hypothetical protein
VLNEILQWIAIIILAVPKAVQVVQDFRSEEEE